MDVEAKKLDGTRIAAKIREEVGAEVAALVARGVTPRLDAVLVGEDPASKVYVGSKAKTLTALGMESRTHNLPKETKQLELEALVDCLNADPEVDGILIMLQQGRPRLVPCTPAGIMEMLRREEIGIVGRRAVVVGRSDIVGKPMAMLLLHAHATVTVCHSRTSDLASVTQQAEILVAAVGVRSLIGPEYVAEGAVVVDVGMHRITDRETVEHLFPDDGKKLAAFEKRGAVLAGDVDFVRVAPKAGRITPVPGGVGPLTIAMLMANTVTAAKMRRNIDR
jgi:methylenetetrahydrofolate dehydrogenase (NADP+)/methenyltetrahydrofolate cyclohydrolase